MQKSLCFLMCFPSNQEERKPDYRTKAQNKHTKRADCPGQRPPLLRPSSRALERHERIILPLPHSSKALGFLLMACYHVSEMKAKPKSTERKFLAAADGRLRESVGLWGPWGRSGGGGRSPGGWGSRSDSAPHKLTAQLWNEAEGKRRT